jgi:hypothetical protein
VLELAASTDPWWETPAVVAAGVSGIVSVSIALLGSWFVNRRAQRDRHRTVFEEAFAACVAYVEFPYAVHRRRNDDPAAERIRISEQLRAVQERIDYSTAWMWAESRWVAMHYETLATATRNIFGPQIGAAWDRDPITKDSEIHATIDRGDHRIYVDEYLSAVRDHFSFWPVWIRKLARSVFRRRNAR